MTGTALKAFLMRSGKTQSDVANIIGETKQNFNSFLRSDDLRSSVIERVAMALHVPVSTIYGEPAKPSMVVGDNSINNSGNIINGQIDKCLDLLKEKDVQFARFQDEISDLIATIKQLAK